MMLLKEKQGFSLIEIATVITVLGIALALSLPRFFNTIENMRSKEGDQVLLEIYASQKRFFLENGNYTDNLANLDIELRPMDNFNTPAITLASDLAHVQRSNGAYDLRILETGVIQCYNDSNNLCDSLGY